MSSLTRQSSSRSFVQSRCHSVSRRRFRALASSAAVLAAALAHLPARGQNQLLDIYGPSLTSYLPTSATPVQGVMLSQEQRGVNIDGSLRFGSTQGWTLNANPFSEPATPMMKMNDIRLDDGTYTPTEIDLALPCIGPSWVIGRSYNGTQPNGSGGFQTSNGYQGKNWFQMSQPELVFVSGGYPGTNDTVYIVYGADRYIEFKRSGESSTEFKAKNGAAGILHYIAPYDQTPGDSETLVDGQYVYHDQVGNVTIFWAPASGVSFGGQIWQIQDAAGNVAYVGTTSPLASDQIGYDSSGRILTAYDSANRQFTYTYSTIDSVVRLTDVVAQTCSSGNWSSPGTVTTVGQVDYAYYQTGDNTWGNNGDLKLVTLTTPLSPASTNLVRRQYYRYYSGTFNSSTNPGNPDQIQIVLGYEGARAYDWLDNNLTNANFNDSGVSTSTLQAYASIYLEYNSGFQVNKVQFNGECGCSGGGANGTYELTYGTSSGYSADIANTSYDVGWGTRTVIQRPDGTYETQYFDETGQPLSRVVTDGDPAGGTPPNFWATSVTRDSNGLVSEIGTPASQSAYTHSTGTLTEAGTGVGGLINVTSRQTSGDGTGLPIGQLYRQSGYSSSTADYVSSISFTLVSQTVGSLTLERPLGTGNSVYPTATTTLGGASPNTTGYSPAWYSSSVALKQLTTTLPLVSTGNNGSNASNSRAQYLTQVGRTTFTISEDSIIGYNAYDSASGQLVTSVNDADTTQNAVGEVFYGVTIPSGFASSGTPMHLVTTYTYDPQSRVSTITTPDGIVRVMYYTMLGDGRSVTLSIPNFDGTNYYGPVSYSVSNHAGKTEAQGIIALTSTTTSPSLWITSTSPISSTVTNPILALNVGSVTKLSTNTYDAAGIKVQESRSYFVNPTGTGWPGTQGTNFDSTFAGYDPMGRRWRSVSQPGDVTRTVFDALGRPIQTWKGTNDHSFTGGSSSGTDNMVEIEVRQYDGGSTGQNSLLTSVTRDADGNWSTTSDQRVMAYTYDFRGRAIVTAMPLSPHSLTKYDNLGRTVAVGQYNSTSGLTVSSDPTSVTTNRIGLSETFYDEMGRSWDSRRHEITQSSGADADSIDSVKWFDPVGRLIKVRGESLTKTRYDRVGRTIDQFTLASDDDSGYSDVYASGTTNVGGDTVVEENETVYDNPSGNVLMRVFIARHPGYSGTGELDAKTDGDPLTVTGTDINGRVQITAMYYDGLNRLTDSLSLGTNGIVGDGSTSTGTFGRSGYSLPARSDSKLITSYSYNPDGTVEDVTDPKGIVTRTIYDGAQRKITTIQNRTGGSTSTPNRDNDIYTQYTYANGLQTQMWVDLNGNGTPDTGSVYPEQNDQVTTYLYGVTSTATNSPSQVNSNSLLRAIIYPDSTNTATTAAYIDGTSDADVTSYAYNALGERIYQKDPAGNVIQSSLDLQGRPTVKTVSTLASGFDGSVRRIETSYDNRGNTNDVQQFPTTTSTTARDEVQYTFDDWGNVAEINQDPDSAIGVSGRAAFNVQFSYAKVAPTNARNTIRRTGMTMPDGTAVTYSYDTSGSLSDTLSRVNQVEVGSSSTPVAQYTYYGQAQLGQTYLSQPQVFTSVLGSSPSSYPGLDNFNRITANTWVKDITAAPAYYSVNLTYDRNSNISLVTDSVFLSDVNTASGVVHTFDANYGLDNLNRVSSIQVGSWVSSTLTPPSPDQVSEDWTVSGTIELTQTGNWDSYTAWDDGSLAQVTQTRTHDIANKLVTVSGNAISHDANGNLTDPSSQWPYKYTYDAFNRLVGVSVIASRGLHGSVTFLQIGAYRYNGLDQMIMFNEPPSLSGNPNVYQCFDDRWRVVATYVASDSSPKEQFYYHAAGLGGKGGSSYIDSVIFRDRDNTTAFPSSSDGTLEERMYYCQNWRSDVSAIVTSGGSLVEWVKYTGYGVPLSIPAGDLQTAYGLSSTDVSEASALTLSGYDVRADINLDGSITSSDVSYISANVGLTQGRDVLSNVGNRHGLAGYENSWSISSLYFVRNRDLNTLSGRWMQQDPLQSHDLMRLYVYSDTSPLTSADPSGLFQINLWQQYHTIGYGSPSGFTHTAKWEAGFDSGVSCRDGGGGWLILRIQDSVMANRCSDWSPFSPLLIVTYYYEAFWADAGDTIAKVPSNASAFAGAIAIDTAQFTMKYAGTAGQHTQNGEAVFICSCDLKGYANTPDQWGQDLPNAGALPSWNVLTRGSLQYIETRIGGSGSAARGTSEFWSDCSNTNGFSPGRSLNATAWTTSPPTSDTIKWPQIVSPKGPLQILTEPSQAPK